MEKMALVAVTSNPAGITAPCNFAMVAEEECENDCLIGHGGEKTMIHADADKATQASHVEKHALPSTQMPNAGSTCIGNNLRIPTQGAPATTDGTNATATEAPLELSATRQQVAWNPLDDVDSALLSALCDARERKGLLRLEQVLVDFMRQVNRGYIEVGGPYNGVVVGGQSGSSAGGSGSGVSTTAVGSTSAAVDAAVVRPGNEAGLQAGQQQQQGGGYGQTQQQHSSYSSQQQQYYQQTQQQQQLQQQQQRGMKQTSFQRLILHRLADRFKIVRENPGVDQYGNGNANRNGYNTGGSSAGYPPGLIRLVKTKESTVPARLLINLDLSVLVNYKNPRARVNNNNNYQGVGGSGTGGGNFANGYGPGQGGGFQNPSGYSNNQDPGSTDNGVKGLGDALASTSLSENNSAPTTSSAKPVKNKITVMKRNVGSGVLEGSNSKKKEGRARNGLKGKKLSEREKAYEEARARIFGVTNGEPVTSEGTAIAETAGAGHQQPQQQQSDSIGDVTPGTLSRPSSCSSIENEKNIAVSVGGSSADVNNALLNSNEPNPLSPPFYPQDLTSPLRSSPLQPFEAGDAAAAYAEASPTVPKFAMSSSSGNTSPSSSPKSAPAATVKGMNGNAVRTRAVYRNRQQEENDPDFKRRSDVRPAVASYQVQAVAAGVPLVHSNGGAVSYVTYGHAGYPAAGMQVPVAAGHLQPAVVMMSPVPVTHHYHYGQPAPLHPQQQPHGSPSARVSPPRQMSSQEQLQSPQDAPSPYGSSPAAAPAHPKPAQAPPYYHARAPVAAPVYYAHPSQQQQQQQQQQTRSNARSSTPSNKQGGNAYGNRRTHQPEGGGEVGNRSWANQTKVASVNPSRSSRGTAAGGGSTSRTLYNPEEFPALR